MTFGKSFDLVEAQFLTLNGNNNAYSTQSYFKSELIWKALRIMKLDDLVSLPGFLIFLIFYF